MSGCPLRGGDTGEEAGEADPKIAGQSMITSTKACKFTILDSCLYLCHLFHTFFQHVGNSKTLNLYDKPVKCSQAPLRAGTVLY